MLTITEILNNNREAFIQQLEENYNGEPETNWNNIFNNIITELFGWTLRKCWIKQQNTLFKSRGQKSMHLYAG